MFGMVRVVALAASLLGASAAQATTFEPYSSFNVLGDSLSDTGNVHALTLGLVPASPPYWNGHFSNGPVWAHLIAEEFRALRRPTTNFAFGGAQASGWRNRVPDLPAQARALRAHERARGEFGPTPLVAIGAGGNDLFGAIADGKGRRAAIRAARTIGETTERLVQFGVRDFVIMDLPDLGKIPRYRGGRHEREARRATLAFNGELARQMALIRSRGVNVIAVSLFERLEAILADPDAFGFTNTTTPCLRGRNGCTPERAERFVFVDTIHPTAKTHALFAEAVREEVLRARSGESMRMASASVVATPVPAPVLLVASGLAALALVRRRRIRAAI